jgi:hypothetical protein
MRQAMDWEAAFDFIGFRVVRAPTSIDVNLDDYERRLPKAPEPEAARP